MNLYRIGTFLLALCFIFLSNFISRADETGPGNIHFEYNLETRASFSGGENTPFWFVSNIHGLGSPVFNNGYVKGEIFKRMDSSSKFDWGVGADLTGGWNIPAAFAIRQLYGELHYKRLWFSIGSRNLESEYNDRKLSTGDLLVSGNAMAIPQARIGTNGFAPFWGTKGWFSIRTYLSYGFFTDSKWMKNWVIPGSDRNSDVLYCSRGFWIRIGNVEKYPFTFDVGIEMATQFGGTIVKDGKIIKMPTGFKDWVKAFIPYAGSSKTPVSDQSNVQGNMNGEYNIALSWSPSPDWTISAYFEHYFEDQSQMTFEYGLWKDGLWGVKVSFPQNKWISKFLYEYIATADQTGAVYHDATISIPEQISGRDGYYTHYLYGAWQNWGMTLGTPLAISPLYNTSHLMTLYNTRFIANHFGLEGNPCDYINWRMLLTFSRNWGTYIRPLPRRMDSFSGLVEIGAKYPGLKGWYAKCGLAWDRGALLGNNFGGMLSIGYEGNFSVKSKH